jgi:hypothetical protein
VKVQKFISQTSTPYYSETQDIKLTLGRSRGRLCTNSTPVPPFRTACVTCNLVPGTSAFLSCPTFPTATLIPAFDALATESARAGAVGSAYASPVFATLYVLLVAFFVLPLMGDIARMSQKADQDFGNTFSPLPRLPCVYRVRAHSCWGIISSLVSVTLSCALGLSAIAVFGSAFNDPVNELFKATCPLPVGVQQGSGNSFTPPPWVFRHNMHQGQWPWVPAVPVWLCV